MSLFEISTPSKLPQKVSNYTGHTKIITLFLLHFPKSSPAMNHTLSRHSALKCIFPILVYNNSKYFSAAVNSEIISLFWDKKIIISHTCRCMCLVGTRNVTILPLKIHLNIKHHVRNNPLMTKTFILTFV